MEDSGVLDANFIPSCNGSMQPCNSDNIGDELLDGLDSYFDDITDCLTISRLVSDSVIKGMVNAVTEEAAERITLKELEVASLKERLHFYESGAYKVEKLEFPIGSAEAERKRTAEECFVNFGMASEKQFHMLQKKIEDIKICKLLPGQSKMKESEKWAEVDQTLNTLRNTMNTVCKKVDSMICFSKPSLYELQKEREFQDEIEAMVIHNFIRYLKEECEVKLWEQRAQFCGSQITNQMAKFNQLSSLRQELTSISRTLSNPEVVGHPPLNGSHEGIEECNNDRRNDHFHLKVFNNHISRANSISEENGKSEESKSALPDTLESAQIKQMSKEDLISYLIKMKRNHESKVQEVTEELFTFKREYLKERGPSSSLRRDKEFEAFRKTIPKFIVKLDNMLTENDKLSVTYENSEMICSLKTRIDALLSENHQIKGLLTNKSKEVKRLSSQFSNAADKMSNHSLAEANLLKQIRKLKCDIKDMRVEASIREDVCSCILKELIGKIRSSVEDSNMESMATHEFYEIIFREFALGATTIKCDIEDSDMESIIMQEISGIIFTEAAKDAKGTIDIMKMKFEVENERRVSLEASVLESKKTLNLEIKEKEQLKQEILKFSALIEEKEKLVLEKGSLLMKEKEQYNLIVQELNLFRNQANQKDILVSESRRESNMIKSNLEQAMGQIQLYEKEITQLKGTSEEMKMLRGIIQEKETALSLLEGREIEHKKQVESIRASEQILFKAAASFEGRTMEALEKNNLRLKKLKFQLDPLIQNNTSSRRMESVYKQKLERRYSDLQKAEAEVDLLGDEVDALLSLLEKIYIALYHYSPVLQHYPGIMETLKLVKRELSAETSYDPKRGVETAKTI